MGATPACMAKQASERNRATPAVSAMSLAAVSTPLADIDLGRCRDLGEPGGDASQGWAGQASGGVVQVGVEPVQVPAQPVDALSARR